MLEIFKELQVFSVFKKLGPESFCFMFMNSHEIFSCQMSYFVIFGICSVASDSQNAVLELWQLKKLSAERMFYIST